MAEDSSSGSLLSNFQYLAHLLDPYYTPPLNLSEHLQRTCEHRHHVKCWNEGTQQLPQNNKENPTLLFGCRFRLIFKHNLCWGWRVSTLEKKLGFGHAFPFCLAMGYTGIPYVRYVIICTSNFMGSRWLKPHLPHDSLAIPLWEALLGRAELCLETTGATTPGDHVQCWMWRVWTCGTFPRNSWSRVQACASVQSDGDLTQWNTL